MGERVRLKPTCSATEAIKTHDVTYITRYNTTKAGSEHKNIDLRLYCLDNLSRLMTKQIKWMCAKRRLRSAWASAESDQSLRCPHEES